MAGHPGEKITEGLDGLRTCLAEYSQMGARFAKWRAVITIADGIPSWGCIEVFTLFQVTREQKDRRAFSLFHQTIHNMLLLFQVYRYAFQSFRLSFVVPRLSVEQYLLFLSYYS